MVNTFKQFINRTALSESSMSRIFSHIEGKGSFGVISAFRGEHGKKENIGRHGELKKLIREKGYGFIEMRGGYKEEGGFVNELSLFIPNIKKKAIVELGTQYDQHSVIYKDNNEFVLIGTNKSAGIGKTLEKFVSGGKDNLVLAKDAMKDFFSALLKGSHRGKKFLFRMEEKEPLSFNQVAYIGAEEKWIEIYNESAPVETEKGK